jgi:hypothetical protein
MLKRPDRKNVLRSLAVAVAISSLSAFSLLAANASGNPLFGGGDSGVAQSGAGEQNASDSFTAEGITVSLTGIAADDTRTVIGLEVSGRDEDGLMVVPLEPATITDQDGRVIRESGGSADQGNPRLVTRYFPPLDIRSKDLTLRISGLRLHDRPENGIPPAVTEIDAAWTLDVHLDSPRSESPRAVVNDQTQNNGQIGVVVDEVLSAATGTVVRGHFEGLAMNEAPEVTIQGSLTVDGSELSMIGWSLGFGEARDKFELRFAQAAGNATLAVALVTVANPHDALAAAAVRAKVQGADPATFVLTLPGN